MDAFGSLHARKYMSLATWRRNGARVLTPVWFAQDNGKLYVMTRNDSGKLKRIRDTPNVEVAPCTLRGKPLGPFTKAVARIAPDQQKARRHLRKKYLLARLPLLWKSDNVYLEIAAEQ